MMPGKIDTQYLRLTGWRMLSNQTNTSQSRQLSLIEWSDAALDVIVEHAESLLRDCGTERTSNRKQQLYPAVTCAAFFAVV